MSKMTKVLTSALVVVGAVFAVAFGTTELAFADITTVAASAAQSFSSNGNTALASIGGAIIGLSGVAVLYKWVKAMFFG